MPKKNRELLTRHIYNDGAVCNRLGDADPIERLSRLIDEEDTGQERYMPNAYGLHCSVFHWARKWKTDVEEASRRLTRMYKAKMASILIQVWYHPVTKFNCHSNYYRIYEQPLPRRVRKTLTRPTHTKRGSQLGAGGGFAEPYIPNRISMLMSPRFQNCLMEQRYSPEFAPRQFVYRYEGPKRFSECMVPDVDAQSMLAEIMKADQAKRMALRIRRRWAFRPS